MVKNLSAFLAQNAKKIDNEQYVASERLSTPSPASPCSGKSAALPRRKMRRSASPACARFPCPAARASTHRTSTPTPTWLRSPSAALFFPNLNDAELQQSYGVMGAEQLITTMLTPAEFEDYSTKVLQVNGFQSGEEMLADAKN